MGSFTYNPENSNRANDVGNELDSALASALDNFRDLRFDAMWSDDEIREESNVIDALDRILDVWDRVAPYILD